ncbi:hypothetical protein BHE74_00025513 [Ensete ventricosum]|nr:hypothetical protein BHE74_00025513 [Ensete ventricosum]
MEHQRRPRETKNVRKKKKKKKKKKKNDERAFSLSLALFKHRNVFVPFPGQVYIVYLGEHKGLRTGREILEDHHSLLRSVKNSTASTGLLHCSPKRKQRSYPVSAVVSVSVSGFVFLCVTSAFLSPEMEQVVSAFPGEARWSPHTTRSWEFIMQEEGLQGWELEWMTSKAKLGKEVIVGVVDSGSLD